jgi:hypothetical protein
LFPWGEEVLSNSKTPEIFTGKRASVTVVAQLAKAPGIHGYVAGSIPAVTPRYCTIKNNKCSSEHQKEEEKKSFLLPLARCHVKGKNEKDLERRNFGRSRRKEKRYKKK